MLFNLLIQFNLKAMRSFDVIKVVDKYFECANDLNRKVVNKPLNDNIDILNQTSTYPVSQRTYYFLGVIPFFRITKYAQSATYKGKN